MRGLRGVQVNARELRSLARQLETAAGVNRRHEAPVKLSYTHFSGDLEAFANQMHAQTWKVHKHAVAAYELLPDCSKVSSHMDACL